MIDPQSGGVCGGLKPFRSETTRAHLISVPQSTVYLAASDKRLPGGARVLSRRQCGKDEHERLWQGRGLALPCLGASEQPKEPAEDEEDEDEDQIESLALSFSV